MTSRHRGAPLRFATFLAPNMVPVYRFLADRIGDRLGRPVELVVGRSFDQFESGEADLGVICGLPYVWLADRQPPPVEPLAAPVLDGDRYGGRPIYYSDVIIRRDSPITRLEELRGCSWAYNDPASHSGHTVTLYGLVTMGSRPGFFSRVVEAGFHQRAIRLVHTGVVDAAAIDSQVLAIELRDHPQLADRLRVVGAFGPSTIQPVVAASRLPNQLKDEVRKLLVELGDDPLARPTLDHGLIDRFSPVDDAAYDDIRAMLATIQDAGWPRLTQAAGSHLRPAGGPSSGRGQVAGRDSIARQAASRAVLGDGFERREQALEVQDVIAQARDTLTVKRVFGEPYEKDGVTVIPAARVQGGAGGGSGEDPQGQGKGSGSGFGVTARPVGAFIIRDGELSWRPAVDVNRIVLGGQVVVVVALLTIRAIIKARAKARS